MQITRHSFTVDDYHAMVVAGVLKEDDRVELIEGEIVDMAPVGLRHAAAVNILTRWLVVGCGTRAMVQVRAPMQIGTASEPQPDLVALRPQANFYRSQAATPDDVLLLIEVADSSLPYDRAVKLPLYAQAGVQEFWLVDLVRDEVHVHREPTSDGFRYVDPRGRGARWNPWRSRT